MPDEPKRPSPPPPATPTEPPPISHRSRMPGLDGPPAKPPPPYSTTQVFSDPAKLTSLEDEGE